MRTIGNILWFIFGGLLGGLAWIFAGCIWCITIIGIPVGLQCFKFATLASQSLDVRMNEYRKKKLCRLYFYCTYLNCNLRFHTYYLR